jgi:hypothetical protein
MDRKKSTGILACFIAVRLALQRRPLEQLGSVESAGHLFCCFFKFREPHTSEIPVAGECKEYKSFTERICRYLLDSLAINDQSG